MRYKRFIINNYRAIVGPLEVNIRKSSLTPIIGVNESGKTTILHAIFSFDYFNDSLNDGGRHLKDVANLYRTSPPPSEVAAEIELSKEDLKDAIYRCYQQDGPLKATYGELWRKRNYPDRVIISRNLTDRKYSVITESNGAVVEFLGARAVQDAVARQIIASLPYILYFDDFRDKIPERIEIPTNPKDTAAGWLGIIEQLFTQTDKSFSVFKLATMEVTCPVFLSQR